MYDFSAWRRQNEIKLPPHIQWRENEPMSRHTTFRIGGSAALYAICETKEALCALIMACKRDDIRYIVLGNGSNVLVSDEGFDGVVISTTGLHQIEVMGDTVLAQAGASLTATAIKARDQGLTGMEFTYGIPGSVGGAVFMNAGAYDGEMQQIVRSSSYLDAKDGTIHALTGEAHAFAYRDSIYRSHPDWIILESTLQLQVGDKTAIGEKMEELMRRRIEKQPLDFPSAGSVFKRYPGRYTAQMIDEAGLKGKSIGGAQVSPKHAGFIVNTGGATCRDVLALIELIQNTIYKKFDVHIACELIEIR